MTSSTTASLPSSPPPNRAKVTKRDTQPDDAIILHTYQELRQFIDAFARRHFGLLILVGAPGLAKSRIVREVIGPTACWIEGNATPFGMYSKLYRHQDQLVVIDDVDNLYSDRTAVRLLKCLCQTEDEKTIAWHSDAAGLERHRIPREFVTKSRVIIIANNWKTLNENVVAVQDRGHMLFFRPTAQEVHAQVAEWFGDEEIHDWFGRHLHLIANPSMRHYVRAAELKKAGMNWLQVLTSQSLPPKTVLVAKLKADSSYASEEQRIEAFAKMGGGSRATYFNHAKKLRNASSPRTRGPKTIQSSRSVLLLPALTSRDQQPG